MSLESLGTRSKGQLMVYFIFLTFCYKFLSNPNTPPPMKITTFLSVVLFVFHAVPAGADGHKEELKMIGQRIKQAVKEGKLTEKEAWAKWEAVQEKYHDHGKMEESEDRIMELEMELKARELEMEIERMEKEHESEMRELDFQMQRMESDFDRERRDWEMEHMHWDRERREMERRMQSHNPHHPDRSHQQAGPREGPRRDSSMSDHSQHRRPHEVRPGQGSVKKDKQTAKKKKSN